FSDAAATTPITASTNASTVYARFSVPGTYTIIASANNTVTTCQNFDSLKLTVLPATVSVVPANDQLCVSGSTTLDISPNPASFGNATYQWYSSPDNVNYTAITGATASSYTTPTINSTTYYRVEI